MNPVQAFKVSVPSQARLLYELLALNIDHPTVADQGAETQHWHIFPISVAALNASDSYVKLREGVDVLPVAVIVNSSSSTSYLSSSA